MSKNEFDALLLKKLQEEAFEFNPDSWKQLSGKLSDVMPEPIEVNPFDALLAAKLQEDSFEYNPASWQQLAERLENPESKPKAVPFKKWKIALGGAAALLLTLGLATIFNGSKNDGKQSPVSVANNKDIQKPASIKPTNNSTAPTQQKTIVIPSQHMAHQPNVKPKNTNKSGVTNILNPVINTNNQNPKIIVPHNQNISENQVQNNPVIVKNQVQPNPANSANKDIITAPIKKEETPNTIAQNPYYQPWPDGGDYKGSASSKPKTNISFAGGVNYGNINTGYTAGVSIKRKIGSDFFVDGTVAMMYNNNVNNIAANNGPSVTQQPAISNTASKPAKGASMNNVSAPALNPIQKLYYVQMNPSVGYQIEDKVALSVGGDFQKMLNSSSEIVQPDNVDTKVFPTMDIGLTTKSEFTISPNLQAGLIYREGLNNLFKADAPYVNRRYLQVQFKYNIPLK